MSPKHPAIRDFEAARDSILQVLDDELGLSWKQLCLFEVGLWDPYAARSKPSSGR
jgi:hypothetical protein